LPAPPPSPARSPQSKDPRFRPSKYAEREIAFKAGPGTGFKSPAESIAEAVGGRYCHREKAYILTPAQAEAAKLPLDAGFRGPVFDRPSRFCVFHPDAHDRLFLVQSCQMIPMALNGWRIGPAEPIAPLLERLAAERAASGSAPHS
jgi:hypothetical protein